MPEVELVLKADNSQYIQKVREAQKVNQDLHDASERGMKREKGLIEDIEKEIARLETARKKAWRIEDIEKYNQKLAEAKKDLQDYDQAGLKTQKTTESLTASIGKWVLSLGGATLILNKLKEAFLDTVGGMNLFNQVGAVTKQVMNDIVSGVGISLGHIQQAIATQKVLNNLRIEESFEQVEIAKLNNEYQQQYAKAIDRTLSQEDKLKSIDVALAAHNKAIDLEVEHVTKAKDAIYSLLQDNPTNEKLIVQYNGLRAKLENLDAQRVASTKRLISLRSGVIQDGIETEKKKEEDLKKYLEFLDEDYNKKQLKQQEEYQKYSLKLLDDYQKSRIDSLTGPERLKAERDFGLLQIREAREQLAKLGTITEGQDAMFTAMGANVWKSFYEGMVKEAKVPQDQKDAISKALLENMPDLEGLRKASIRTTPATEDFSIWKLIGIDPDDEEGQKQIDSIKQAADTVTGILNDQFDQKVEIAQRERELLDNQIAETQRSLELEANLMEEGFANNVTSKQKELEELKKQRELALIEEEKAIKRQQAFETIQQVGALITASAQTFKAFPGPLLPIAIAVVAAMFAAFLASKVKARDMVKMGEGGSGTETGLITGRSHAQGGEKFLDHVEIERGEAFGVLSRQATGKYGNIFHEMVSSFNRNEMPEFISPKISNSVRVDNNGPNSRLDKVIREQEKMNLQLKQSQIYNIGNKRIIKSGNKVRIIG